jgi:hypothetical protein
MTTSNEQVVSPSSSSMETAEQTTMNLNGKKLRRERKMQERWTITTKNESQSHSQSTNKAFLGVEFPPIAVLRRKFSSLPAPTILNPLPIKRKDSTTIKPKGQPNNNETSNPSEDDIDKANPTRSEKTQVCLPV